MFASRSSLWGMKAPKLEPHKEHAAAFQRAFQDWHMAAQLLRFLEPLPRSRGRPRKSNWEKERRGAHEVREYAGRSHMAEDLRG